RWANTESGLLIRRGMEPPFCFKIVREYETTFFSCPAAFAARALGHSALAAPGATRIPSVSCHVALATAAPKRQSLSQMTFRATFATATRSQRTGTMNTATPYPFPIHVGPGAADRIVLGT